MAAPTSIIVEVDRAEYSRFEEERNTILVTLDIVGTGLTGEQISVSLMKARRARDEIVTTQTITLSVSTAHMVQVEFYLPEIIDEKTVPKVRRGKYFVRATSVTNSVTTANSLDFRVSLISVARLKADYLHGTDQFSSDQLLVLEQPELITGVTVESVSLGHSKGSYPLSYNYALASAPQVLGVTSEGFTLVDGQTLALSVNGAAVQTATFNTADFSNISAATAAEIAAVINDDIDGVVATDSSGSVLIQGDLIEGTNAIFVDPVGTATTELGLLNQFDQITPARTLSWCGGPSVSLSTSKKTYVLRKGASADYIKVRVSSIASLPQESHAEDLIIDRKPLDDERISQILESAISWVEDVALSVYVEPTRITTVPDPTTIAYPSGQSTPTLTGADWDCVVDAVTYTKPSAGHWLGFKCPYQPLICFEDLYGQLSNTRVVDIQLEWVEAHEKTAWVELVPFNQQTAFSFIGLLWVESIRGPMPLPNFWNFTALVGFRKTPEVLLELIAKKAAMDILTIAGQAFRGGFSSQSISRDGVSESVSYTASATFGVYSASIEDYRKWIKENLKEMKGAFRGPNMVVM